MASQLGLGLWQETAGNHYRGDAWLEYIAAFSEVAVKIEIDGVNVVCAGQGIGIGDMRRRSGGIAVAIAPEQCIAGPQQKQQDASTPSMKDTARAMPMLN
jgi:hypothetical protein